MSVLAESALERKCVKKAKEAGCLLLKTTPVKGFPDRVLLCPHRMPVFMEFKREAGQLSPLQKHWLQKLQEMGYQAEEVDTVELFSRLLGDLMSIKLVGAYGLQVDPKQPSSGRLDLGKPRLVLRQQFSLGNSSNEE
jgi:hypothetical protein